FPDPEPTPARAGTFRPAPDHRNPGGALPERAPAMVTTRNTPTDRSRVPSMLETTARGGMDHAARGPLEHRGTGPSSLRRTPRGGTARARPRHPRPVDRGPHTDR